MASKCDVSVRVVVVIVLIPPPCPWRFPPPENACASWRMQVSLRLGPGARRCPGVAPEPRPPPPSVVALGCVLFCGVVGGCVRLLRVAVWALVV